MLSLQRTKEKALSCWGNRSAATLKSHTMSNKVVNGTVKVATGVVLIGAGTVLQSKGLTTLGAKILGK